MDETEKLVGLIRGWSPPLQPEPPGEAAQKSLRLLAERMESSRGERRADYRAVLFDVYGTLFVSGSGDIGTVEDGSGDGGRGEVLAPFAAPGDLPRLRAGFAAAVKERHAAARRVSARDIPAPEIRVEEVWADVLGLRSVEAAREFALRFELAVNPVYPMPGLPETLARLRASGALLGIVSNAQFFTPLLFRAFLGGEPEALGFDPALLVYSFREGEAKPSPRLFEKAARGLASRGVRPEEALFVGNDMLNDVWAAKTAGFAAALYAGDGRSLRLRGEDPRCASLVPDMILENPAEAAGAGDGSGLH